MLRTASGSAVGYKRRYEELLEKGAHQDELIAILRKENQKLRLSGLPLPDSAFEFLANLQYRVKDLSAQLRDFRTGEKYVKMREENAALLTTKEREAKKLKSELADAHSQIVTVRNIWEQIADDLQAEHSKELLEKARQIKKLASELLEAQIKLDALRDKIKGMAKEMMQVKTALDDEKGKVLKLTAQIKRNYETSSKPSSQSPNHKIIPNNREKSGKRPGGQPGHVGHTRKKHVPTTTVAIPTPDELLDTARYRPTGKTETKQLVDIRVSVMTTEYTAEVFRDLITRQRVHADFPEGVVNDVNYSGNVKAFAFLLNNRCNVSIANVADFISELTDGELRISTGMINGLSKEFSQKTEAEQKKAISDLLLSPVMNVDFTTVRANGKSKTVLVTATPDTVMYFAKDHKGHEGIKGTPVEDYQHTLVHDHDKTFYSYGSAHQECVEHPSRYLLDSAKNEPSLKWNREMRKLIREMIRFINGLDPKDRRNPDEINPGKVAAYESKYDDIIRLAKDEYEYVPPTKYYKDGFNLYKKMTKYRAEHLLFLHDRNVPPTNNLSERLLRVLKRKAAQVMTFRSDEGLEYLCDSLGIVASLRAQGGNLYEKVAAKFAAEKKRPVPGYQQMQ